MVPQRAAGRDGQRGPDRRPDVVAERSAGLPQSSGARQGRTIGVGGVRRRRVLLQRDEPGDGTERRQSECFARRRRYVDERDIISFIRT